MALVPWRYQNPHANEKYLPKRLFSIGNNTIQIEQEPTAKIDLHSNTGKIVWDSAFVLATYIASHCTVRGKSVLELGSGTGLVGISAWAEGTIQLLSDSDRIFIVPKGAFPTYLTDLPDALDITRVNVARNQERITHPRREDIHVQALTWGKLDPDVSTIKTPDFILGSDVIYIRESFDALIETLQTFCGLDTKILLAYKTRGLGETDFQDLAQKKGFVVQKIPTKNLCEEFQAGGFFHIIQLTIGSVRKSV